MVIYYLILDDDNDSVETQKGTAIKLKKKKKKRKAAIKKNTFNSFTTVIRESIEEIIEAFQKQMRDNSDMNQGIIK